MNAKTQRLMVAGPAGSIEVALDEPDGSAKGVAIVCHPHPVHGGTLDNKVVQTLARAWMQLGWRAVRFNFRGVGASVGTWDEGRGEIDDAMAVLQAQVRADEPLAIAGFSFGAYVASQLAQRVASSHALKHLVLVGPATQSFDVAKVRADTLVVHGEQDDVVPLAAAFDWARPQGLPVMVVPGSGHFFHGQLPLLKALVMRHVRGGAPDDVLSL